MLDLHMHSQYSGDIPPGAGASVDALCARAVEAGLTTIAVTDHCDIDGIYEGYFPPLDFEGVRRDVFAAKEKYAGCLTLLYGLELGQGPHMKAQAEETLERCRFEYVIGSVHGARHHRFCQRGIR
ncbi:MAG: PHP domain-containing protein [Acutalibacteraceae bacterium]